MADKKKDQPAAPSGLDQILSLINTTAPTADTANPRQPLGPPKQFYTEQGQIMGTARDPSFTPYLNGDEWVPAYSMSTEDRARLKARMNAAGLYGTNGYTPGSWTRDDAAAYQTVLESANAMGIRDANVVIDNLASEASRGHRVMGPRAPLVSRITDPEAVRRVVRSTALDLTGQRLSDEEEARIVNAYRSYEQGLDQSAYAAGGAAYGTVGGTVATPMSPEDFASSQIESSHAGDVAGVRYAKGVEQILSAHRIVPNVDLYGGGGS
jgi:hypothetical protein